MNEKKKRHPRLGVPELTTSDDPHGIRPALGYAFGAVWAAKRISGGRMRSWIRGGIRYTGWGLVEDDRAQREGYFIDFSIYC